MKTKLRASKISIEKPREDSEVWVHVTIQQVFKDENGNTVNIIPRYDYISKPLKDFMPENYNYYDPITGELRTISGVQVMFIISSVVLEWMQEKYGGTVDEEGNLWV